MAQLHICSSHHEDDDDLKYDDENNEEIIILIPMMDENYVWTGGQKCCIIWDVEGYNEAVRYNFPNAPQFSGCSHDNDNKYI